MNEHFPALGAVACKMVVANENLAGEVMEVDVRQFEEEVAEAFQGVLDALRIDTKDDPHSQNTAKRYAKMMVREVCRGRFEPPPAFTTFPNTKRLDELVAVGPITVRSLCSHHFCPVLGRAWIGYVPDKKLAGLSKFARVVHHYAARPQVQEEMVAQICGHLWVALQPKGLAIVVKAQHTCMTWRGVQEGTGTEMVTNIMEGVFRDKPEARAEFLRFVHGS